MGAMDTMAAVIVCPGIHPAELTEGFLTAMRSAGADFEQLTWWVLPPELPPYGPEQVYEFVREQRYSQHYSNALPDTGRLAPSLPERIPTIWLGFSAGVVGAIAAARQWQRARGQVQGLIALDGWGVPLGDSFPRYRLSHDRFTAQSCEWLGSSDGYFYAEPGVGHLELWRSPQSTQGKWRSPYPEQSPDNLNRLRPHQSISAAQVIVLLIEHLRP